MSTWRALVIGEDLFPMIQKHRDTKETESYESVECGRFIVYEKNQGDDGWVEGYTIEKCCILREALEEYKGGFCEVFHDIPFISFSKEEWNIKEGEVALPDEHQVDWLLKTFGPEQRVVILRGSSH